MTLNDLLLLIKHYSKWVVVIPVVCMLLTGGFAVAKDMGRAESYTATAMLTVTDPTNSLSPTNLTLQLSATARNVASAATTDGIKVMATIEDKTQSVKLSASASTAEAAEEAANDAAQETASSMQEVLFAQAEVFRREGSIPPDEQLATEQSTANAKAAALEACIYTIAPAATASNSGSSNVVKYTIAGLVGGLFMVVLVLALYGSAKRPIKVRGDIARIADFPVVNGNGGSVGVDLARASLLTTCGSTLKSVCVVAEDERGRRFASQLGAAFSAAGDGDVSILSHLPLTEDVGGYFEVQKADATLVCVTAWKSTAPSLSSVLEELKLARANIVGIVLV